MKITVCDKSTRRLSPSCQRSFVEDAEEQLPEGIGSFFDFVEQQKADLEFFV